MRPSVVVVGHVLRQDGPQVRLVDDERVIQALGAERADNTFGDRVGVRRPGRGLDYREPLAGEDRVEANRELPVAVADEEAQGLARTLLQLPAEIPRLLRDPDRGGMGG